MKEFFPTTDPHLYLHPYPQLVSLNLSTWPRWNKPAIAPVLGGGGAPGADSSVLLPPLVNCGGERNRQVAGKAGLVGEDTLPPHQHCLWVLAASPYPKRARWRWKGAGLRKSLPAVPRPC